MTLPSRFDQLSQALLASGLDAAALNPSPTLGHLTGLGFHLMERPVVLFFAPGKTPALVLPELETPKLDHISYKVQAFPYGENPSAWVDAFRAAGQFLGLDGKRIGIEPRALRILEYRFIEQAAPGAEFVDGSLALSSLRLKKDAAEIAHMKKAVEIAQNALEATLPLIKIGMTEQEVATELVMQLLRHGS